jgi:hypothetical protein
MPTAPSESTEIASASSSAQLATELLVLQGPEAEALFAGRFSRRS